MFANTDPDLSYCRSLLFLRLYCTGLLTDQLSLLVLSYCTVPNGPNVPHPYYPCIYNEFNSLCSIVKKKPVTFFAVWVVCWLILAI
jgi:hypothetical protein